MLVAWGFLRLREQPLSECRTPHNHSRTTRPFPLLEVPSLATKRVSPHTIRRTTATHEVKREVLAWKEDKGLMEFLRGL